MRSSFLVVSWIATFLGLLCQTVANEFVVVGYLPEYRFYINIEQAASRLTDLILFSIQPTPSGKLDTHALNPDIFTRVSNIKSARPKDHPLGPLRVHVSVGGGGRSEAFPQAVASDKARGKLVRSLVSFAEKNNLDGIDLDWESPMDQKQLFGYIKLVVELKAALKDKILSVALHPSQTLGPDGLGAVDRIHLMTYDNYRDPNGHATLSHVEQAVQFLRSQRVPDSKIVLGIPAYGRSTGSPDIVLTYSEIVDKYAPSPETTRVQRDVAFDGIEAVQAKVTWAKTNQLKGVMVWEVGQDSSQDKFSLLQAIANKVAGSNNREVSSGGETTVPTLYVALGVGCVVFVALLAYWRTSSARGQTAESKQQRSRTAKKNK